MMMAEILAISASLDKQALTLSSQSSFTAKLLGLRSCIMGKDEQIDSISENYFLNLHNFLIQMVFMQ